MRVTYLEIQLKIYAGRPTEIHFKYVAAYLATSGSCLKNSRIASELNQMTSIGCVCRALGSYMCSQVQGKSYNYRGGHYHS